MAYLAKKQLKYFLTFVDYNPVRRHITSTTTDKATAHVFSKISVVPASVDVLVYPGVLTPSHLTNAINNIALKLVTKLIVIGIYIYISLIYNVLN